MKEITHPEKGKKVGAKVSSTIFGTYPIGKFNTWHGGTHLESMSELVAIADGRIIAYQITDNYESVAFEGKDQVYSKCFVLIQHDYVIKKTEDDTKEGKPIRFYSFYQHLMPLSKIKKTNKFPYFFCDKKHVIKAKEQVKGAKMYRFIKGKKTEKTFIPNGTTIKLNKTDKVTKNKHSYTRVTSVDGIALTNKHYISESFIGTDLIKKYSYVRTEYYTDPNNDTKGGRIREKASGTSKIVNLIPYGKVVAIDMSTKDKSWIKLADGSGYTFKKSLEYKSVLNNKKITKDKVIGCDIPVKANQTIGHAGKNGTLGFENYRNCHFEIFTDASDSDLKYFINNKAKNSFKTPRFFEIENGAKLKANIVKSLDISANTPIKVLKVKDCSIKVEIIEIMATIAYSDVIDNNDKASSYNLKADTFDTVNTAFNNTLKVTDKLYYIERCDESGKKISNKENDQRIKDKLAQYRNVKFNPKHIKQLFWVKETDIDVCTAGEKGKITTALTQVYIYEPKDETEDLTINEALLIENKGLKTYTNKSTKEKWYAITCSYIENNKLVSKKGWISENNSKFTAKNPHNWKEFGFEIIDAGKDYVYEVEGYNRAENSGDFINKMWELIDTDGNKRINRVEIINAFSDSKKLNKIAKFICKHKSEWSYTIDKIKEEAEQFYKIGIDEATGIKKDKLTEKKDKLIDVFVSKLENLLCWKEIQNANYTPPVIKQKTKTKDTFRFFPKDFQEIIDDKEPQNLFIEEMMQIMDEKKKEEEKPKRVVPKGDVFHYFHPIAFLQHMKLITATNVIYIYSDGTISKLDLKGLNEITYVYVSSNGKEYKICTCELLEIDERLKGVAHDQATAHAVKSGYDAGNIVSYSHASSRKKYTYPDGTIRTYGKYDGEFRRVVYNKGARKTHIVKLPNGLNTKVNNKSVKFAFTSTARTYCGPEHFACFIGALTEVGYADIVSGGMCEEDGTCFPSISHNNGQSVDTSYLDDDIREQNFINAMNKFGFDGQLRGYAKKKFDHTTAKSHHNSHLHSGVLKPKYK